MTDPLAEYLDDTHIRRALRRKGPEARRLRHLITKFMGVEWEWWGLSG